MAMTKAQLLASLRSLPQQHYGEVNKTLIEQIIEWADANSGGGTETVLARTEASAAATVDFALTGSYDFYKLYGINIDPSANFTYLEGRLSNDSGVSFEADVGDYAWTMRLGDSTGTDNQYEDTDDTEFRFSWAIPGASSEVSVNFQIEIHQALSASKYTMLHTQSRYSDDLVSIHTHGSVTYQTAEVTDAIRIIPSAGDITGSLVLVGVNFPAP